MAGDCLSANTLGEIIGKIILVMFVALVLITLFSIFYHGPRVGKGEWGTVDNVSIMVTSVDYAGGTVSHIENINLSIRNNGATLVNVTNGNFWLNAPLATGPLSRFDIAIAPGSQQNVSIWFRANIWGGATLTYNSRSGSPSLDFGL